MSKIAPVHSFRSSAEESSTKANLGAMIAGHKIHMAVIRPWREKTFPIIKTPEVSSSSANCQKSPGTVVES